jgi:Zn-dependent protease with chaperone function
LNFFAAQDKARRSTRRLVFVYLLATAVIIAGVTLVVAYASWIFGSLSRGMPFGAFVANHSALFGLVALVVLLVIAGATIYKTSALSSGGARVAESMGGTLVPPNTTDPTLRRLRNIVEEMAIASGVPVPDIYVMEQENGINAFAAGFEPADAAIAVTRGTLDFLDRDELQGVIAHEFSHVLNGDMRLNIRLMGVLFGIMVIALIGRTILRGTRYGVRARDKEGVVIIVTAFGLMILGGIGILCARIIKSGVSRQREYLADASAVQFTRQTSGIANALKKIGGYKGGSYFRAADPEEVSHMLFGTGSKLSGLFATHPPLTKRIQALDKNFRPEDYPTVKRVHTNAVGEAPVASMAGGAAAFSAPEAAAELPATIADRVGDPGSEHVAYAAGLRDSIPALLYDAAHSQKRAYLLTIALVLGADGKSSERQFGILTERMGRERTDYIRKLHSALIEAGPQYRLPLMEIAFPALKRRPESELGYLVELVGRLIDVDGDIDLSEYCYYRVLVSNLGQALDPSARRRQRRATREPVRKAAIDLLRIVARHGHDDIDKQRRAFAAGIAGFGKWGSKFEFDTNHDYSVAVLDRSLELLQSLNGDGKKMLLEAASAAVMSDRNLTVTEAELIRAVCATLNCPLPPILAYH